MEWASEEDDENPVCWIYAKYRFLEVFLNCYLVFEITENFLMAIVSDFLPGNCMFKSLYLFSEVESPLNFEVLNLLSPFTKFLFSESFLIVMLFFHQKTLGSSANEASTQRQG